MKNLVFSTLYPNEFQPNFGIFVENSVRHVAASGIETQVVAPLGIPPWPMSKLAQYAPLMSIPRHETWRGLSVHRPRFSLFPSVGWRLNPWLITRACLPLLRQLHSNDFAFDVIDAQFFYPCGVAAVQMARALKVPVMIKARGADITYWGTLPWARRRMVAAAHAADLITAVSQSLAEQVAALGIPENKIRIHYTGVDLERFTSDGREEARQSAGFTRPTILSVGALIERKDYPLSFRALALVPDVDLVIAGDGPDRAKLEALALDLGLKDRVKFLGPVPHDQLSVLFRAADMLALTSRREGLANVLVEALACGTPVVTMDVEGAREAVDRPTAGLVVTARTPEAVAEAFRHVLGQSHNPALIRAGAERFSWTNHVASKRALLEEVTGKK